METRAMRPPRGSVSGLQAGGVEEAGKALVVAGDERKRVTATISASSTVDFPV